MSSACSRELFNYQAQRSNKTWNRQGLNKRLVRLLCQGTIIFKANILNNYQFTVGGNWNHECQIVNIWMYSPLKHRVLDAIGGPLSYDIWWFYHYVIYKPPPQPTPPPTTPHTPWRNGRHFVDDILNAFSWTKNCIFIKISLKVVPKGPIENKWAFVQAMAWHRIGDKRQVITWTNADPVHRRIYAALRGDELIKWLCCSVIGK